jgi:hypothetical protein
VLVQHAAVSKRGAAAVQAIAINKHATPSRSLSTMSARADVPAASRLQDAGAEDLLDLWRPLSVREHYDQMDAWRNRLGVAGKVSAVNVCTNRQYGNVISKYRVENVLCNDQNTRA